MFICTQETWSRLDDCMHDVLAGFFALSPYLANFLFKSGNSREMPLNCLSAGLLSCELIAILYLSSSVVLKRRPYISPLCSKQVMMLYF